MRGFKVPSNLAGRGVILRTFLFLAISIASVQLFQNSVNADQLSWTNEPPAYSDGGSSIPTSELDAKNCINQQVFVSPDTQSTQICVFQKDNFRYGYYQKFHNPGMWNAYTENKLVVGIGSDSKMYKVENISYSPMPLDLSVEGDLYYRHGCAGCPWGGDLYIYKDFIKNLSRDFNLTTGTTYTYDDSKIKILRYPDNNQPLRVNRVDASDNGRWLIMEIIGRGIVRLDRQAMEMKQISGYTGRYGVGLDPRMEMAISDDGSHVVIAGHNTQFIAYDVNDQCGSEVNSEMSSEMSNACPSKQLNSVVDQQYPNGYFSIHKPAFDSEGGELTFYIKEQQSSQIVKKANLFAAGYSQAKQLDYLALGDSYSSGEGDTATTSSGQKYYLANTDVGGDYENNIPREKCHQSTRAYPFLLADEYNIPVSDKFETVACSGAKIGDIASQNKIYNGQSRGGDSDGSKPRLEGIHDKEVLQNNALIDFIPGREYQIEFVRKYKPKVVTVGVSGNDVNFGSILVSCTVGSIASTCEEAQMKDATARLGDNIGSQFNDLTTLYQRLHQASPNTRIVALSYPKFVSTGHNCGNNVHLDDSERLMAEKGVSYLNDVIKHSAQAAGVAYLNIEDSLNGKRLCDTKSPYVTGITNIFGANNNDKQESFHPNSQGNQKIASHLIEELGTAGLLNYSQNCSVPYSPDSVFCPDHNIKAPTVHPYFAVAMNDYQKNTKQTVMTNESVSKNQPKTQKVDPFTFKPNSTVKRELHSDPIDLGNAMVGGDGGLDAGFTIPSNTPVGYHTLIVTGESYSGELIELTQTILVTSDNPNDLDENSILDVDQPCGAFLEAVNKDDDFDSIDDACDPEISESSPYRVRNGNIQKDENPDYMYIERNTAAASVTGVSGDYDPDNDGWAIVAQSTKPQNSGIPANFWIDESKMPHVSIRTHDKGCVQFTPRSLEVVMPNKLRKLKAEAKNTNTCRTEPASADTDNNGVPDDQQPLYRARNGITTNGEDINSIYLERDSVAAEAQLGISDYSHANVWNLVAISHNDATKANFVKLVMVNDDQAIPTIFATQVKTNAKGKTTTTCVALQPQNTNTTTINNQDRKLKKATLPEGEGCE